MSDPPGGPGWEPPSFSQVEMVPGDLLHFGDLVGGDIEAVTAAWSPETTMTMTFPNLGGVNDRFQPMPEGMSFLRDYFSTFMAQSQLMADVVAGLTALQKGAVGIHVDVLTAEGDNAFDLYDATSVRNAFSSSDVTATEPGNNVTDQAMAEFDEAVAAGSGDDGENGSFDDILASDNNLADQYPRNIDVRETVWEDLEGAGITDETVGLEAHLPNEGLAPHGHPGPVEIAEPGVYRGVDPESYEGRDDE